VPNRLVCVLAVLLAVGAVAAQRAPARTFETDPAGAAPPGFTFAATRQPQAGTWVVRADSGGHHLVHEADDPVQPGVSLAMIPAPALLRDVVVAVRIKLTGGGSGGLVWHYEDAQNYYAVGLDLARHELAMYRVVQGNRIRVDREDDLELDDHAWHSLKVVHEDNSARVYLSGIRVFEVRDRTFRAGATGLWAASGSRVAFDDLRTEPAKERER
jgi:hypothetical protein